MLRADVVDGYMTDMVRAIHSRLLGATYDELKAESRKNIESCKANYFVCSDKCHAWCGIDIWADALCGLAMMFCWCCRTAV